MNQEIKKIEQSFDETGIGKAMQDYFTPEQYEYFKDFYRQEIERLLEKQKQEILDEIDMLKGFTNYPDLWIKIQKDLNGNLAMKEVSDFSSSQIILSAKDITVEEVKNIIKNL